MDLYSWQTKIEITFRRSTQHFEGEEKKSRSRSLIKQVFPLFRLNRVKSFVAFVF